MSSSLNQSKRDSESLSEVDQKLSSLQLNS